MEKVAVTAQRSIKKQSNQKWNGRYQIFFMLLPNLILFLALTAYPIVWALRFMFFDYDGVHPATFNGMENFVRLFTRDDVFWSSVKNTFVYAGGKLLFVLPLAFLVALLLNEKFRGNGLLQAIIFSPTIMSSAVMALMFYLLFNAYNGDVNRYLMASGLIHAPINWLAKDFAMMTVIIVAIWGGLGNYMVYFLAGLQTIPKDIYESAELDGVSYWQRMFYITLPMLGPILRVIMMLAILTTFQDIQSVMVLTEGGPFGTTEVVFLYIYQLFFPISVATSVKSEIGYGAAASVVTGLLIGVITLIYLYISRKLDKIF